jgi:hypothetical protein
MLNVDLLLHDNVILFRLNATLCEIFFLHKVKEGGWEIT